MLLKLKETVSVRAPGSQDSKCRLLCRKNPSSINCEVYACNSTLVFAGGSPVHSSTGIGTYSSSFVNPNFSRTRRQHQLGKIIYEKLTSYQTGISLSSFDNTKTLNNSNLDVVSFRLM